MIRTLIAGVVGGIAMFAWMSFAHTVLPIGHQGVDEIPNEGPVLAAMQESLGASDGLYIFPGLGLGRHPTNKEWEAMQDDYMAKLKTTPSGLLVYHPPGAELAFGKKLAVEAGIEIAASILAAFLLAAAALTGLARRVAFVTTIGAVVSISAYASYWNWYGFPTDYTLAAMFLQVVAFAVAGVPIALLVKKG
jgi:uncharacterized membrane protein YphA (DoxX/SURF4 family)